MKVCPVCGARAFDDAQRCFGCLYEFGEAGVPVAERVAVNAQNAIAVPDPVLVAETGPAAAQGSAPPFLIRFTPTTEASGGITWRCAVEVG